jgi:hypothetical protein
LEESNSTLSVLSWKQARINYTKSGASSVGRSGTLEETLFFVNYELMFKVTNEEPWSMLLKSWSDLGINTKDKTIKRP